MLEARGPLDSAAPVGESAESPDFTVETRVGVCGRNRFWRHISAGIESDQVRFTANARAAHCIRLLNASSPRAGKSG
jgi:hypothetical protein